MISTKGRYALRVMIDLAEHQDEGYIPLRDIAKRQEISKKYLEIIVKELVKGRLIAGVSGKGGGYRLLRNPADYSLGEIVELLEGSLVSVACLRQGARSCPRAQFCKTVGMWKEYSDLTHDFFYGRRLSDLAFDRCI